MEEEKFTSILSDEKAGDVKALSDINLPVCIELARTKMRIRDILELDAGSIVEFDKLAGESVDLLVNDKKFAEGEVVVIDEHFGIRLTNLTSEDVFQRDLEAGDR